MLFKNITAAICIGCKPWDQMNELLKNENILGPEAEITIAEDQLVEKEPDMVSYITTLPKSTISVLYTGNLRHTAVHNLAVAEARYILFQHYSDGILESVHYINGKDDRTLWLNGDFVPLTTSAGSR